MLLCVFGLDVSLSCSLVILWRTKNNLFVKHLPLPLKSVFWSHVITGRWYKNFLPDTSAPYSHFHPLGSIYTHKLHIIEVFSWVLDPLPFEWNVFHSCWLSSLVFRLMCALLLFMLSCFHSLCSLKTSPLSFPLLFLSLPH